jgi:hypothetical protein
LLIKNGHLFLKISFETFFLTFTPFPPFQIRLSLSCSPTPALLSLRVLRMKHVKPEARDFDSGEKWQQRLCIFVFFGLQKTIPLLHA